MKKSLLAKSGPFLILLYGSLVAYYYFTGLLAFLVNPVYNKLILIAGALLLIIGIYWIMHQKSYHPGSCDEKTSKTKEILSFILLTIPLIFGVFFQPKPLSSASALLRGVSSDLAVSDFSPAAFAKPPEERTLVEWIRILNVDPEPSHYEGQEVTLQGSIINDESLPQDMFHIGQFILTCCAADARSIALPVQYEPVNFEPINDQWIELKGVLTEGAPKGQRQVIIQMSSITPIEPPENPYAKF